MGFPGGSAGKESACKVGDLGLISGLGRSPGEGKGYSPLQCSGLESSMDCVVCGVTKSQTRLSNFQFHFASVWDECNCAVVWAFFDIAFLWDWNENWPFPYQTLSISDWPFKYQTLIMEGNSLHQLLHTLTHYALPLEGLDEAYFTCSSLCGQYQSLKT